MTIATFGRIVAVGVRIGWTFGKGGCHVRVSGCCSVEGWAEVNPTVRLGEAFDDLWSGDDTVIDERRTVRGECYCSAVDGVHSAKCQALSGSRGPAFAAEMRKRLGMRADGELVGQLRLPDEFLPVAAGEMFP